MDDAWETSHELDPTDPKDAWYDADGDYTINLYEYFLDTDPNNNLSPSVVELTPLSGPDVLSDAINEAEGSISVIRLSRGQYTAEVIALFELEYKIMIQGGWNDDFSDYNPETFPTYWHGENDEALSILHIDGDANSSSTAIMDAINFSATEHFTLGGALNINSQIGSSSIGISNCSFTNCTFYGIGIYHREAIRSGQVFINKTLIGNNLKGGMYTQIVDDADVRWRLFNCTINNPNSPEGGIDGLTADLGILRIELTNSINRGNLEDAFNFHSFHDFKATTRNSNVDASDPILDISDLGNSIDEDAQFRDPLNNDWSLLVGSPCIDTGVDVGLSFNDAAPDMGAIESGTSSLVNYEKIKTLSIYPNPFSDQINIAMAELVGTQIQIILFDAAGNKLCETEQSFIGKVRLETGGLSRGIYLLQLNTRNNQYLSKLLKL